jgi:hypothetical protein
LSRFRLLDDLIPNLFQFRPQPKPKRCYERRYNRRRYENNLHASLIAESRDGGDYVRHEPSPIAMV